MIYCSKKSKTHAAANSLHHALQCSSHQSCGLAQERRGTTTRSQLHLWGQRPSVNEVRRFSAMFKNTVSCIPVAPPLLCGIPDADTIRSLNDYTLWLDSLPEYGLLGYNAVLRQILVNTRSDPINHVPGRVVLLTSLFSRKNSLRDRGGKGSRVRFPPSPPRTRKLS